ncbi:unnamed protein product [Amoebophrya sp. A120]|nr:unnamed protein product [Amoebophrya sp. A120]|eukprot:GSA120T00025678001.1
MAPRRQVQLQIGRVKPKMIPLIKRTRVVGFGVAASSSSVPSLLLPRRHSSSYVGFSRLCKKPCKNISSTARGGKNFSVLPPAGRLGKAPRGGRLPCHFSTTAPRSSFSVAAVQPHVRSSCYSVHLQRAVPLQLPPFFTVGSFRQNYVLRTGGAGGGSSAVGLRSLTSTTAQLLLDHQQRQRRHFRAEASAAGKNAASVRERTRPSGQKTDVPSVVDDLVEDFRRKFSPLGQNTSNAKLTDLYPIFAKARTPDDYHVCLHALNIAYNFGLLRNPIADVEDTEGASAGRKPADKASRDRGGSLSSSTSISTSTTTSAPNTGRRSAHACHTKALAASRTLTTRLLALAMNCQKMNEAVDLVAKYRAFLPQPPHAQLVYVLLGCLLYRKQYQKVAHVVQAVREDWLQQPRPNFYVLCIEALLHLDPSGRSAVPIVRDAARFDIDLPLKIRLLVAEAMLADRSEGFVLSPHLLLCQQNDGQKEPRPQEGSDSASTTTVEQVLAAEEENNTSTENKAPVATKINPDARPSTAATSTEQQEQRDDLQHTNKSPSCEKSMDNHSSVIFEAAFRGLLPEREYVTSDGIRRAMCLSWLRLLRNDDPDWHLPFRQSWRNRRLRNWAVQTRLPAAFFRVVPAEFRRECVARLGMHVCPEVEETDPV